jgi:hypothetical protein
MRDKILSCFVASVGRIGRCLQGEGDPLPNEIAVGIKVAIREGVISVLLGYARAVRGRIADRQDERRMRSG